MGAGQFCTKPGMVFLPAGKQAESFADKLQQLVASSTPFHLLTKSIHSAYDSALAERKVDTAVTLVAEAPRPRCCFAANSALFETDAAAFLGSDLGAEIFGPTTLLVRHSNRDQLLEIARTLEGQLTATIHGTEQDLYDFADLIAILEQKAGASSLMAFPPGSKCATPWCMEVRIPQPQTAALRRLELGRFSDLHGPSVIKDFRRSIAGRVERFESSRNPAHGRRTNDPGSHLACARDLKVPDAAT